MTLSFFETYESAEQIEIAELKHKLSQSEALCTELTKQNKILQCPPPLHIAEAIVENARIEKDRAKANEDSTQLKSIAERLRALRISLQKRIELELPETVLPPIVSPSIVSPYTEQTNFDLMNCPFMQIGSDILYFRGGDVIHSEKC